MSMVFGFISSNTIQDSISDMSAGWLPASSKIDADVGGPVARTFPSRTFESNHRRDE